MKRNIVTKALEFMRDPDYRFKILASMGMYNKLDDETFLKKYYQCIFHKELDLQTPKTFNAKLQWLKLYDRRPEYTMMVDKYRVRDYIAKKIGREYLIPLLGVWDDPDEIDFDSLPQQFVLKCNHNSGLGMCICRDKSKLDVKKVKADLRKGLQQDYYITFREWPYRDVPRKIICEKYMEDNSTAELVDYKFFCFDGRVDCVMVCLDRSSGNTKFYFFDRAWNLLRYNIRGKEAPENFTIPKPSNMEEMFEIAEKLSKGLPFARIDLYSVSGRTYFGEITFFPDSGFDVNLLLETDRHWGEMISISKINSEV